jgi:TP901 family phage tail tape measure protein
MAKGQGSGVVLGFLKYVLGLDSVAFDKGLSDADKRLKATQRSMMKTADSFKSVGAAASKWVTLPIIAAGAGILKMAGNFDAAMNEVGISTQATGKELAKLKELALDIGKNTTKSASESAKAMDSLAKAGLSTSQILDGAARATVALAEATGSELDPAAAAITDTLTNFKMNVGDLPKVINQITGAVNQSKFDFADFQYAMGSAGGVAGKVGVNFEDFAAVLAGTSSSFSSGQDAGTSFKTMLIAIGNPTKKATAVIEKFSLSFYDAAGKLKPMRDIAQQLQEKFAGLSDQARTSAMADLFGSDAMRSGLGLMSLGAKGLDDIAAAIAKTDAAAQAAKRMTGFNAEMEKLGGSLETLAIKIADAGLIQAVTALVTKVADFVDWMSAANPEMLKWGTVIAVVAAAIGPLLIGIGGLVSAASTLLPLFAPIVGLFTGAGAAATAGAAGTVAATGAFAGLGAVLGPIALGVAAAAAAWALFGDKIGPALAGVWAKMQEVLGPKLLEMFETIKASLTELWSGPFGTMMQAAIEQFGNFSAAYTGAFGQALIASIGAMIDLVSGAFKLISGLLDGVSRLLSGDFSGAWKAASTAVVGAGQLLLRAIDGLSLGALSAINRMVTGIGTWIGQKLRATWDWAISKIGEVGKKFAWLYDVVVGHSYVPDMVTQIGTEIARLDAVMVKPIEKATKKSAEAFRNMATETKAIIERLFPEASRLAVLMGELAKLEANTMMDPKLRAAAMSKLLAEIAQQQESARLEALPAAGGFNNIFGGKSAEAAKDKARTDLQEGLEAATRNPTTFEKMQGFWRGTLNDGFRAALNGDLSGFLKSFWTDLLSKSFEKALNSVADSIAKLLSGGGSGGGGGLGSLFSSIFGGGGGGASGAASGIASGIGDAFAGMRAGGGAVMAGKTYMVGERGRELFTPNRSGFVTPNRATAGNRRGGNTYYLSGNLLTPEFWEKISADARGHANAATARVERRMRERADARLGRP